MTSNPVNQHSASSMMMLVPLMIPFGGPTFFVGTSNPVNHMVVEDDPCIIIDDVGLYVIVAASLLGLHIPTTYIRGDWQHGIDFIDGLTK